MTTAMNRGCTITREIYDSSHGCCIAGSVRDQSQSRISMSMRAAAVLRFTPFLGALAFRLQLVPFTFQRSQAATVL